ncbi:hypothetical protein A2881_01670 [Candidatus Peribacteria bacterium RIFCSPHIGHO2_01_FULL_55_13]|nr:MAG: hypothetical protein A2881_01670 [Candidatus Peribacteria bacterium RIFCSPHIGHO2_01_FULL_55_13]OGJ65733.1 MAG: hypothetical protein A3F36_03520 [Candidatus Peribacteria bacterium RIFCSPHIGHO2_12_FULL_55_11]
MFLQKQFWNSFWGICILIAFIFAVHAWNLRLLYTDPTVRNQVKTSMEAVAEREGWLISDMPVRKVTRDWIVIHYRRHVRGPDPKTCYYIALDTHAISPCSL